VKDLARFDRDDRKFGRITHAGVNPFVDPEGCLSSVSDPEQAFRAELENQ
jgi:hypothetical protein